MRTKELKTWKKCLLTDLEYIGLDLKEEIKAPCVLFLEGELGAGKTTFAKSFCSVKETGSSPSYSLINDYGNGYVHGDLYRLKSKDELIHIELDYYAEDASYILLEWGKQYFNTIERELDESFEFYVLEIKQVESDIGYRSFTLFQIIS